MKVYIVYTYRRCVLWRSGEGGDTTENYLNCYPNEVLSFGKHVVLAYIFAL